MAKRNSRWVRTPRGVGKCFATWELKARPGYLVKHCGHPTAIWPYYGLTPEGRMI